MVHPCADITVFKCRHTDEPFNPSGGRNYKRERYFGGFGARGAGTVGREHLGSGS